ncbi:hypothetical protein ON010_g511 [Phytophthora cinnamomi]|nr:hypothetical protein ON010_g511 [Phytophthora cinnamomi]
MGTPSSAVEARHQHYQTVASATSSVLSIIGAFYIIGRYWYARRLKAKSLSLYAGSAHHLDVTKELIHIIAYLDLFGATGRAFGVLPTETFNQDAGDPVTPICKIQAFIFFYCRCWGFSHHVRGRRADRVELHHGAEPVPLGVHGRGPADAHEEDQVVHPQHHALHAGHPVHLPHLQQVRRRRTLVLGRGGGQPHRGALVDVRRAILLGHRGRHRHDHVPRAGQDQHEEAPQDVRERRRQRRLLRRGAQPHGLHLGLHPLLAAGRGRPRLRHLLGQHVLHAGPAARHDRAAAGLHQRRHLRQVPHLGGAPCARAVGEQCRIVHEEQQALGRHAAPVRANARTGAASHGHGGDLHHHFRYELDPVSEQPGRLDPARKGLICVLAPALRRSADDRAGDPRISPSSELPRSLPFHHFDCGNGCAWPRSRCKCHGRARGENLCLFNADTIVICALACDAIQASVCQIVFVNNADDASGNAKFQAADGRIWAQRKTFNEVVGIPIRYFDASIAFVSCNLGTSISNSSQRLYRPGNNDVFTKHAVASSLIHSFGMDADRAAVDFPNLYHHTILSGNLNYDVDMSTSTLAASIDQAYKAESLKRATDTAIEAQIKAIRKTEGKSNKKSADFQHDGIILEEGSESWDTQRSSAAVSSSASGDSIYEEVFTSCEDDLPFTVLKSPVDRLPRQPDLLTPFLDDRDPDSLAIIIHEGANPAEESEKEKAYKPSNWVSFLDDQLPTQAPDGRQGVSASGSKHRAVDRLGSSGHFVPLARGHHKKIRDLLAKSDLVTENTARKWQEVLRYDELRASIEAKEIFTGFEEPPIRFLPSFPRKIGIAATFSMMGERSCRDLFCEPDEEMLVGDSPPAYKDRILAHSLSDTKQRLKNVDYWSCEKIVTSTHKPVCSIYELEIDRFFSYNMDEAAIADLRQGNHALRDKRDVHEFKIKLVKLDANIWTYEERGGGGGSILQNAGYRWRGHGSRHGSNQSSSQTTGRRSQSSRGAINSNSTTSSGESSRHSVRISMSRRKSSIAQVVGRVLRKSRLRSGSNTSTRTTTPNQYSDFTVGPGGTQPLSMTNDRLSALAAGRLELVPVEPVSISTIFPLPSEDVYALQRKVYEVAHLVQNGFQSSARVDDDEESQLAYTNFRTASWREAMANGITHSAITKAVNGGVHIAISIEAEKGHGGQGVLCLKESDLMMHAAPVLSEAKPIPFDVTLTWGGKHVGYLHGDILCSM